MNEADQQRLSEIERQHHIVFGECIGDHARMPSAAKCDNLWLVERLREALAEFKTERAVSNRLRTSWDEDTERLAAERDRLKEQLAAVIEAGDEYERLFRFFEDLGHTRGYMRADNDEGWSEDYADGFSDAWFMTREEYKNTGDVSKAWQESVFRARKAIGPATKTRSSLKCIKGLHSVCTGHVGGPVTPVCDCSCTCHRCQYTHCPERGEHSHDGVMATEGEQQ